MGKINAKWLLLDDQSLINSSGNLTAFVDGVTIERSASGLRVVADGINDQHIDWGTGANQVSAEDVPIADSGSYFSTDNVEYATQQLAGKYILYRHTKSDFNNVAAVSNNGDTTTTTFDSAIKGIASHNNGGGNSTTVGTVTNNTRAYQIPIRDHVSQHVIEDSNGNEVYARLTFSGGNYVISYYSLVSGTETAYNGFTTADYIDLGYVFFSQNFINLPWSDVFLTSSWQDVTASASTILDDNVAVDGMTDLLSGLTTQAQVNAKLDDLGSSSSGEGASLIAIENSGSWYTGAELEAAITEISNAIGGTNSGTRNYTENNVVADNEAVVDSIEKLDLKFGDLASTASGEGASLVGIEDSAGWYTGANIELALNEIHSAIGGSDSGTRNYTENNVVADDESLFASIEKLDLKFGDISSTATGEGASLVGIEDSSGNFTSTDVEGALQELADDISNASTAKTFEITLSSTDITNGWATLSSQVNGTVSNNVVTVDLFNCKTLDGGRADYGAEAIIMRNDAGDTDYIVWLNNVTPTGCTNSSSGITSTNFGDILENGDLIQLDATS